MTRHGGRTKVMLAVSLAVCACLIPALCAQQQNAQAAAGGSLPSITLQASQQWIDSGIDLRAGEKLRITASGEITYPEQGNSRERKFGPEGLPRGFADVIHQYAVGDAAHGALIARLGGADGGQPFLIGASKEFVAPAPGRLFLGINQSHRDAGSAQGSFQVTISILDPGAASATATAAWLPETAVHSITPELLESLPRRVADPQGNPGDMVNVVIVGTEDELVQAFTAAGWVKVDSSVGNAVLTGLLNTLEKKDYLTMPMSTLFLFGRAQDYGFAHAEPVRVAMARNHLRAWKSAYEVDGRPLWCIAATHDVGFERDQRNNKLTHKIDPAIDGEREYVNSTLSATGLVVQRTHVTPANALKEARTATGGSFNSDGRVLVLVLKNQKK